MPKVSVIVPVYNAAKPVNGERTALHRCVDSILNQDFSDLELILIDDGSKDDSGRILDEYAAADERVRVVHQQNAGVSATRNRALEMARGEWIQFLDADDWITPEATKLFVNTAESRGADMVIADFYRVVNENIARKGDIDSGDVLTREKYADYMMRNPADYYYGVLWNKLFRREILAAHGLRMDENLRLSEDFIFVLEYVLHVEKIAVLHVPVYYYVKTEGSLVAQGKNVAKLVRMKLSVIEYYNRFYKNLYDGTEYVLRMPAIYSFLVSFAGDDAVIPMLPGTKKLGEEGVPVLSDTESGDNAFFETYEMNKLQERYLNTVAAQHDLSLRDVKILLYLKLAGASALKEIADFVDVQPLAAAAQLEMLAFKKLTRQPKRAAGEEAVWELTEKAEPVSQELDRVLSDYDSLIFADFTPEERKQYLEMKARVRRNARRLLV